MNQADVFRRLDRAQAEYLAARFAIRYVATAWDAEVVRRAARDETVTIDELRRAGDRLEVTFALRLFSEFESILRDYWMNGLGKATVPDVRPLMDSIARRRRMSPDDLAAAHDVRAFRNDVIHAGELAPRFALSECRTGLGRYLRWLPQQW